MNMEDSMPLSSYTNDDTEYIDGRIVDDYYTTDKHGRIKLHWILRTKFGKLKITTKCPIRPYCFIPAKYVTVYNDVLESTDINSPTCSKVESGEFADAESSVYKLEFALPEHVGRFRRLMDRAGFPEVYEADVLFMERVKAEYDITNTIRIFKDDTIAPPPDEADIPPYVIWYWDIEVSDEFEERFEPSPDTERILAIAYVDGEGVEGVLAEDNEKDMLETFYERISKSVDVVVGYNSDNFDEPFFRKRIAKLCGIAPTFRGIAFLDMGPLIINAEETTLPSWSLDYIAETKLGERKIPMKQGFHETFREDREYLKERCLDDARKLKKLEDTYNYVTFALENVSLSGAQINKIQYISYFGDSITLRESIHRCTPRVIWRCKGHSEKGEKFKGAIVRKPPLGVHQRVAFLDFSSLYVRVIRENWLSRTALAFKPSPTRIYTGEDPQTGQRIYFDLSKPAPVPQILTRIEQDRIRYLTILQETVETIMRERYDMLQKQRKVSGNAMYGFGGDAKTRYYYRIVADTVTRIAREYLTGVIALCEQLGFHVTYADTDGIYIQFKEDDTYEYIIDVCNNLVHIINSLCKSMAAKRNVPPERRLVEIKFESIYDPIIFFRSEKGDVAKKRYVAREVFSYKVGGMRSEPKIDEKGIEKRRGDRSILTKEMQTCIIEFLLRGDLDGAVQYIKSMRRSLLSGELDQKLVLSSSITKPMNEYKTKPPHFRAAQKAQAKGERLMWGKVSYVYAEDGKNGLVVEPVIKDRIPPIKPSGREIFWEKRIMKWVRRFMGAVMEDHEFERKLSGTTQLDMFLNKGGKKSLESGKNTQPKKETRKNRTQIF